MIYVASHLSVNHSQKGIETVMNSWDSIYSQTVQFFASKTNQLWRKTVVFVIGSTESGNKFATDKYWTMSKGKFGFLVAKRRNYAILFARVKICKLQSSQRPKYITKEKSLARDYAVSHHNYFLVSPEFIIAYRKLIRSSCTPISLETHNHHNQQESGERRPRMGGVRPACKKHER